MNNNNLGYMTDPKFKNINRLFVLLFKTRNNDPTIYFSDKYYMSLVEMKDFSALINNKSVFDQPIKNRTRIV